MKQQQSKYINTLLQLILQWQTHKMMHCSFWLLPVHLSDEQGTSFTQEQFSLIKNSH